MLRDVVARVPVAPERDDDLSRIGVLLYNRPLIAALVLRLEIVDGVDALDIFFASILVMMFPPRGCCRYSPQHLDH